MQLSARAAMRLAEHDDDDDDVVVRWQKRWHIKKKKGRMKRILSLSS